METEILTEFEPQVISINQKRYHSAMQAWEQLVDAGDETVIQFENFLNFKELSKNQIVELLELPEDEIIPKLFELTGEAPKGLNLKKMVSLGLIENIHLDATLRAIKNYKIAKANALRHFKFDYKKLIDEVGKLFLLTDEFFEELARSCTWFTTNEAENEHLKHLKKLLDEINYFSNQGIINPKLGPRGLEMLMLAFSPDKDRIEYTLTTALNPFKLAKWRTV